MSSTSESVKLLAGPQLLGIFLDWALQGVLTVQVYLYHVYFPRDRLAIKCLVYGMATFATVQTGLITAYAFDIYVYDNGSVQSMMGTHDAWFAVPLMSAIVSATCQIYFAWRIYVLARSPVLAVCIILLSLMQAGAGFATGIKGKLAQHASPTDGPPLNDAANLLLLVGNRALIVFLLGSALVDVIIAITMTILLLKMKTGIARSDALINKIIRLVVETGTLTASFSVVLLALCLALPGSLVYETPANAFAKIYANTFLTNILNRAFLPGQDVVESSRNIWLSFRAAHPSSLSGPSTNRNVENVSHAHGDESSDVLPKGIVLEQLGTKDGRQVHDIVNIAAPPSWTGTSAESC